MQSRPGYGIWRIVGWKPTGATIATTACSGKSALLAGVRNMTANRSSSARPRPSSAVTRPDSAQRRLRGGRRDLTDSLRMRPCRRLQHSSTSGCPCELTRAVVTWSCARASWSPAIERLFRVRLPTLPVKCRRGRRVTQLTKAASPPKRLNRSIIQQRVSTEPYLSGRVVCGPCAASLLRIHRF